VADWRGRAVSGGAGERDRAWTSRWGLATARESEHRRGLARGGGGPEMGRGRVPRPTQPRGEVFPFLFLFLFLFQFPSHFLSLLYIHTYIRDFLGVK
jgi:hypothetical protein